MDANETLQYVRGMSTYEVTLDSGRRYTLINPDLQRLIAYGETPLPMLRKAANYQANGETPGEISPEMISAAQAMFALNDQMLAEGIVAIDGQDVDMTVEAVKFLPEDEREELLEYLKREKDPLAVAP